MQSGAFDFQQNFFQLFGLEALYRVDTAQLDHHYRLLQAQVHPDKFAHLSEPERRVSLQWATRVNEAYQTLSDPLLRARYLLSLRGVDTQEETNTAMPAEFLMQQMEWREAIGDARQARDESVLNQLEARLRHELRDLEELLADKIDREHDYTAAAEALRKLRFLEKLAQEIISALDSLEE